MIKGLLTVESNMQTPTVDPDNPVVKQVTKEVVHVGLNSPLRETILDAIEEADGVETLTTSEPSTAKKAMQGAIVFVVMFTVLYLVMRRVTASDESEE